MKIKDSKMEKNQYSKIDADNWMILPTQSEERVTTFIDVQNLVLFPKSLFDNVEKVNKDMSFEEIFSNI